MESNVVIIGAGIVGCATALKIKENFPEKTVIVLEKNPGPFMETSLYNSGVIHSGVHQKSNHLKSALALKGGPMLIDFCEKNNVPHRKTGMLVVVSTKDLFSLITETKSLFLLLRNCHKQKIPVKFLTSFGVKKIESNLKALFGIFLPNIWIVDQPSLGKKLVKTGTDKGILYAFNTEAEIIAKREKAYEIGTNKQTFKAKIVINASGVWSDKIAAMAGFNNYKIYPYRGEYYEVISEKKNLLQSTLVYPALPPGSPVKGIHLTKTTDGRMLIGPNAKPWSDKKDNFSVQTPKKEFLDAVKRFFPQITEDDIEWRKSGLRAKTNPGVGENDFIVKKECENPTFINLIGIESPGFTSSFAIGEYVVELIKN